MKTLCLVRHAKPCFHSQQLEDFTRPLDERGILDAQHVGETLLNKSLHPDVILASPATRTLETAKILAQALHLPADLIQTEDNLYNAGVEDLLHAVMGLAPSINTLMVVGHNPGLTWLANYLADAHIPSLPTCGAFCAQFNTDDWTEITTAEGSILFNEAPGHGHV